MNGSKGLNTIVYGFVTFAAATIIMNVMITGTDTGSVLVQTLAPVLLGIVVLFIILKMV